jgi:hypothetical protein
MSFSLSFIHFVIPMVLSLLNSHSFVVKYSNISDPFWILLWIWYSLFGHKFQEIVSNLDFPKHLHRFEAQRYQEQINQDGGNQLEEVEADVVDEFGPLEGPPRVPDYPVKGYDIPDDVLAQIDDFLPGFAVFGRPCDIVDPLVSARTS